MESFSSIPTFRITERLIDTIEELSRRSEKSVYIESGKEMLKLAKVVHSRNLRRLFEVESELREDLALPPSATLFRIILRAENLDILHHRVIETEKILGEFGRIDISRPYLSKIRKEYEQFVTLRAKSALWEICDGMPVEDSKLREALLEVGRFAKIMLSPDFIPF